MQKQELQYQAEKLAIFKKRGGDSNRWIISKGFSRDDARQIRQAAQNTERRKP